MEQNQPIKKLISKCFVFFGTIRTSSGSVIARIKQHQIETSDDKLYNIINEENDIRSEGKKQIKLGKPKYTIHHKQTNEVIATVDSKYNVFDIEGNYKGTLPNKTLLILLLLLLFIFTVGMSFFVIDSTVNPNEPHEIYISEENGLVVEDKWNIFAPLDKDEDIFPSKKGSYLFTINNPNDFDVNVDLVFDEKNLYEIDMVYRIKIGTEYIKGDKDTWLSIDELDVDDLIIGENNKATYILEWYWKDDDPIDTNAGINSATYTIYVDVIAEEIE